MAPIACMLFDLDGTFADTAPDLAAAANHVRDRLGLQPLDPSAYRAHASAGARGLLDRALGIGPDAPAFEQHRRDFLDYYRDHIAEHTRLFDGMSELLATLAGAGIPAGIVTNKPSWLTRPLVERLSLRTPLACVVSADEVMHAKPAPDSLLLACRQIGIEPRSCMYVGDDRRDIDAGRAAGMRTVAAAWGYLGTGQPIDAWGADEIAHSPEDLIRWATPTT
ncbi:MAG: HAD-IA family hydrolase [Nevskiales bacterium]|nr:HAD-IA family hydrolase [Nevskiales bacterium]